MFKELNADNEEEHSQDQALSSLSLWEIEHASVFQGGDITWRNVVALRSLVTGQYLAVTERTVTPINARSPANMRVAGSTSTLVIAQDIPHTFRLMPTIVIDQE